MGHLDGDIHGLESSLVGVVRILLRCLSFNQSKGLNEASIQLIWGAEMLNGVTYVRATAKKEGCTAHAPPRLPQPHWAGFELLTF
ncbi:hypothetical protein LINGRAHAP2_LOCUS32928 [Linum grandiflorum]